MRVSECTQSGECGWTADLSWPSSKLRGNGERQRPESQLRTQIILNHHLGNIKGICKNASLYYFNAVDFMRSCHSKSSLNVSPVDVFESNQDNSVLTYGMVKLNCAFVHITLQQTCVSHQVRSTEHAREGMSAFALSPWNPTCVWSWAMCESGQFAERWQIFDVAYLLACLQTKTNATWWTKCRPRD